MENEKIDSKHHDSMPFNKLLQRYVLIVVINLSFILFFGYLISPLSKVGTISVEGNQDVYVQEIIENSGINLGDSVLKSKLKFEEAEKKIVDQLPQVANSSISVNGINNIIIEIQEFNTVAYISADESYLRVLENGTVLDNLYTISIGNQLILSKFKEGKALDLMIQELKKVDEPILNLISEIELTKTDTNPYYIEVYMNNGNRLLSNIPEFSEKVLYYPQMVQAVEGKKGVFDMEAGIYFIPFMDGQNEESGMNEEASQEIEGFEG